MLRSFLLILIFIFTIIDGKHQSNETLRKTPSRYTGFTIIFDRSDRAQQLHLQKVFRDLKIHRNAKVADIGAGSGWLTVRLAKFIGPKGKVYAEDIVPRYISYIDEEIKRHELDNVEIIHGSTTDPKLPNNTLDAVIILNAYHEFEEPITILTKIRQAMKISARLGILDRDTDQMRIDARKAYAKTGYVLHRINKTLINNYVTNNHYLALNIVVREVTSVGFTFLFSRELGGDFYIAVFSNS
ncbi:unnamed protein product [Rotaria sordida]|uniref:Methyltransferase domain-containing protein n=1 Tax=Rotaria sordida TaxID=392033 RepID=A0A814UWI9_9BILA|nr:unnamed protein product [Rotaria sordida]CAF3982360.1 unnamed protein product [Rotaria sordida]